MPYNIIFELRKRIQQCVVEAYPAASDVDFDITEPNVSEHGDVACNVAMAVAKYAKQAPLSVAADIKYRLESDGWIKEFVKEIKVANPGFINIFLHKEVLLRKFSEFAASLKIITPKQEKVLIEHTNVNPNKAMHIGHLRNAILGDVIKRVLQRVGYQTEVQYYVDDTGVQVADSYLGMQMWERGELQKYMEASDSARIKAIEASVRNSAVKFDVFCWFIYSALNRAYDKDPELVERRKRLLHEIENRGSDIATQVQEFATKIVQDHLTSMADFGVDYDLLTWESDILGFKFWEKTFELLQKSPIFEKEERGKNAGCWVVKSEEQSNDEEHSADKIIVKSDGTVTYTGKDIAYHLWKYNKLGADFMYDAWKRSESHPRLSYELWSTSQHGTSSDRFGHADRVYNVIDVRQSYPQAVVKTVLAELGYQKESDNLRHVAYGVVSLSAPAAKEMGFAVAEGTTVLSMSGRKGLGVRVDDLLQKMIVKISQQKYEVTSGRTGSSVPPHEVAVGALKYFMLRYNPQTDIVFDFDDAMSLEGNTGPYLQYAHARAAGILDKSGIAGALDLPAEFELGKEESEVMKKIYQWPHVLERVADDLSVNLITTYAFELANIFNSFYEASPVLKADLKVRAQRLAIVSAFKTTLSDVLNVLGIAAPEKM